MSSKTGRKWLWSGGVLLCQQLLLLLLALLPLALCRKLLRRLWNSLATANCAHLTFRLIEALASASGDQFRAAARQTFATPRLAPDLPDTYSASSPSSTSPSGKSPGKAYHRPPAPPPPPPPQFSRSEREAYLEEELARLSSSSSSVGGGLCIARPTLLLRVTVPKQTTSAASSDFSVIVRALLDTGAGISTISVQLSELLVGQGGARLRYAWPLTANLYSGHQVSRYRTVLGLQLHSLEHVVASSPPTVYDLAEHPFTVNELMPFSVESSPVLSLVTPKLASLGVHLPSVGTASCQPGEAINLAGGHRGKNQSYQYRFDMMIGQDLLNSVFLVKPAQPVYHLRSNLALLRTSMGVTLLGRFPRRWFESWAPTPKQVKRMQKALLVGAETGHQKQSLAAEEEKETAAAASAAAAAAAIEEELSFNLGACHDRVRLRDLFVSLLVLHLALHRALLFLATFLLAIFLRVLTGALPHQVSRPLIGRLHLFLLGALLRQSVRLRRLVSGHFGQLATLLTPGLLIRPQAMPCNIMPRLAVRVANPLRSDLERTVTAFIDTGDPLSRICPKLVEELQLLPRPEAEEEEEKKKEGAASLPAGGGHTARPQWSYPLSASLQCVSVQLSSIGSGGACSEGGLQPFSKLVRLRVYPLSSSQYTHMEASFMEQVPSLISAGQQAAAAGLAGLQAEAEAEASAERENTAWRPQLPLLHYLQEQRRMSEEEVAREAASKRQTNQIHLGADQLAGLLLMPCSSGLRRQATAANQVLPLTERLSALQTRLGWLLQGVQGAHLFSTFPCLNWHWSQLEPFTHWKALLACLLFDVALLLLTWLAILPKQGELSLQAAIVPSNA